MWHNNMFDFWTILTRRLEWTLENQFRSVDQTKLNSFVVNPYSPWVVMYQAICLKIFSKSWRFFVAFPRKLGKKKLKKREKYKVTKCKGKICVWQKVPFWTYVYLFGESLIHPDGPLSFSSLWWTIYLG